MCSEKKINEADHTHHPSQAGYDACYIPESVRQYRGEPLYILVAWWCLQQHDWVNRNQISEAFRVPVLRASYLMAYLRNKTRRVIVESRQMLLANNVYRYEIQVTRVMLPGSRKKRLPGEKRRLTRRRIGNADTTQATLIWNNLRKGNPSPVKGGTNND
ncbi:CaiF/GrlA family transcriptional regulator [Escherichia coli]|mgnify:FL=1|uniref:CaiF/GrlA family transcriptional regulator n=1 Tax=Escherichia coli TaxID=562 RepID=UPI000EBE3FD1|nr:CaiF/GrlA family transcriptional regulator [Escherichia coli]HCK38362.1 transcriptional regulator CaiF [Shigella sp.]EEV9242521.1 CaiF/GrlA family transcriptional regulator [Escherichia coli]EFE8294234.1 CaiF/GrlA family transcriptional regulator [Escherichia coli]EFF9475045.1 CaiF/GrlA family transcriptional regulator [Escherichia coli]EGE4031900.1 transcriptional regulator CaiF [Escherichia coli]